MKSACFLFAASASFAAFGLTDVYWIGGETGSWNDTANWACSDWVEPNKPNSVDCIVHITNEVPVTIACGSTFYRVGGLSFSGANHTLTSTDKSNGGIYLGKELADADDPVIYVAPGLTVTVPNVRATANKACGLVKAGGGTLVVASTGRLSHSSFRFSSFVIDAGVFRMDGDTFNVGGLCTVRSGARFESTLNNAVDDAQVFYLEENAVFDSNGKRDTLGGFNGYGVVTNFDKLTWSGGPFDFAGRVYGAIVLSPSTNQVVGGEGYLRVGASDTLANATVTLAGHAVYTNVLRFAPGVGAFKVKYIDFGTNSTSVLLKDTDDNPITLKDGTLAVSAPATNLVLAGGAITNMNYTIAPTPFKTTITGGDYAFSGDFNVSGDRTVEQTGGSIRCRLNADGSSCLNNIFYTISGGRMVSYTSSTYPKGVGFDMSGDAHVELRNSQVKYAHRVASGKMSHTIRLSGNAYLGVDDLQIIGESDSTGTAVLDLQGGVMEVMGSFCQPSAAISSPAEGRILFNGGVLRAVGAGNQEWWTGANDPNELVKAYIGSAGAIVDVKSDKYNRLLTVGWPFVTGVDNGTDGGFVKLGRGRLQLSKPYAGTGVFEAREGRFEVGSGMGTTPFGSASVRIGMGEMRFPLAGSYSLAATAGASLSYANCATLHLTNGVALTIGDVARCGHGVLTVMSGTADEALGVHAFVTVNGGLSNDATTGILCQPVFERRETASYNRHRARFLKCENNALVPASPVEFDPAASGSSTVAQITGSKVTVSANASVGALVVERSSDVGMTVNNGVTLSVGPNTAGSVAPILLNNVSLSGGATAKTGIAGGGTIDFGASEGVIVVNGNAVLDYPVNIDTAIAGSGGVTFAAPTLFGDGIRGCIVLNQAGTYTGGTWIENVHVSTTADGSFGTGTIHVSGGELEGGALEIAAKYNTKEFANPVEIAGNGPVYPADKILPGYYGALIVRKGGVTLSGGVTLVADAKIASGARGGQKPVTFSAPIVGPGKLTVSGMSPFRFAAANTYAGGTVIINGTVEVTDAGTLGSGPVKICAGSVLRFVNTSAKTVPNVITGDGRVEMNGAAVTLTSADGFEGDIAGNVSAVGDDGYVKSGEGTVVFTNALSYTGATTVLAGTLRLGQVPLGVPAASGSIAFHLDASAGDTIMEEDGAVVSWTDADGRDIAFTNVVANGPSRAIGALNDMDALYFNGESGRRLVANAATPEFRTVFLVNRVASGSAHPSMSSWQYMGIFGELNKGNGLQFNTQTEIRVDSMFLDGVLHINGDSNMSSAALYDKITVPNNTFVITEAEVAIPVQNTTFAIGDYKGGRAYFGDIAEVIAYDRWLTDEERIATERYLQNKWGLKEVAESSVFTNVLPVATALTVAEGATLDLAGGYQEVASLSGAGTIANSFETQATLVLSSGTSEFSGSFSGDIYLEVAEGATLDLCGGMLTVAGVGGSGRICNGTVVVTGEIQPGGRGAVGILTFATAPVVAGATLVVESDGTAVDAIVVEGDFDMTGLSLSVPAPKSVKPGDYAVVVSGVALSGEFYATDLPDNGKWSVGYTANAAVLSRLKHGALIVVY